MDPPPTPPDDQIVVVPRFVWGAGDGKPIAMRQGPAKYLMFAFTQRDFKRLKKKASKDGAIKRTIECVEWMQKLQRNDMRRFMDIRFNFVIGADGLLYEGRGWAVSPTLPNRYKALRPNAMYIGYQGNEWGAARTDILLQRRKEIIRHGVKMKYISDKVTELHLSTFLNDRMFKPNISEILQS